DLPDDRKRSRPRSRCTPLPAKSPDRDHPARRQPDRLSHFYWRLGSCFQPCWIIPNNSAANVSPVSKEPSTSASRGVVDSPSKSCARIFILPLLIVASTPTGKLQSPCSRRRNSRSACRQSNVSRSFIGSRSAFVL